MSSEGSARLFLAAALSDPVRRSLEEALAQLEPLAPLVNLRPPDAIHLTIHFLGEVEAGRIAELTAALKEASEPFHRLLLLVAGVGAFPSPARPRVLWAGITGAGLPQLAAIHEASASRLIRAGIELERRSYRPHLTLGRVRRDPSAGEKRPLSQWMDRWRQVQFGELLVDAVHLMRSDLSVRPPRYTALESFPLQ